jgi:hypothetical protein
MFEKKMKEKGFSIVKEDNNGVIFENPKTKKGVFVSKKTRTLAFFTGNFNEKNPTWIRKEVEAIHEDFEQGERGVGDD